MLLSDVIMWFLFVVAVLLAFQGLWLLSRSLYTVDVEEIASYLENGRVKPFFIGLPIAVAVFFGVAICGGKHVTFGDLAAIAILALFFYYANIGVAGLATMVGRKLPSAADRDRPWSGTIRGGVVLELAFLFPLLGWFFVLPISLIVGAGAVTSRLIAKRKERGTSSSGNPISSTAPTGVHTEKTGADEVVGAAG